MITPASGNLLTAPVEALVNTVNTEGVMGKGIALQFKQAFPAVYDDYVAACKAGRVTIGKMHVCDLGGLVGGPRWIINFPTKRHWRSGSGIAPAWWIGQFRVVSSATSRFRRPCCVQHRREQHIEPEPSRRHG